MHGVPSLWPLVALQTVLLVAQSVSAEVNIARLPDNPLLRVDDDLRGLEENINGPSLIKVPQWVDEALGSYYLYFAHHQGKYIRLAYGDDPGGPFHVYEPGTLSLADSLFPVTPPDPEDLPPERRQSIEAGQARSPYAHIASPDVHVVPELGQIRMYYHGLHDDGRQYTRVAISTNGIDFEAQPELLGRPYFRAFQYDVWWYALAMPGVFYRSENGLTNFVQGPTLFDSSMRHSAVAVRGNTLHVFYTKAGDAPESILHATINLRGDWLEWTESSSAVVLRPETQWEGASLPVQPSARGAIKQRVNQLRDPAFFDYAGTSYLYYSIAGESGIAVVKVSGLQESD